MSTYTDKFQRLAAGEDVPYIELVGAAILTGLVDPIEPANAWYDLLRELKRQSSLGPLQHEWRYAAWRFGSTADFAMGIGILETLPRDDDDERPDAGGDRTGDGSHPRDVERSRDG